MLGLKIIVKGILMMKCENCIHFELCPVWDKDNNRPYKDGYSYFCQNYSRFIDKSQIIELPMKITDKLKEELTKYCYGRCIDEL